MGVFSTACDICPVMSLMKVEFAYKFISFLSVCTLVHCHDQNNWSGAFITFICVAEIQKRPFSMKSIFRSSTKSKDCTYCAADKDKPSSYLLSPTMLLYHQRAVHTFCSQQLSNAVKPNGLTTSRMAQNGCLCRRP